MKRYIEENETTRNIIDITESFFKIRFPNKNIQFEKECGYFYEWMARIHYQKFRLFDNDSMKAYNQAVEELRSR